MTEKSPNSSNTEQKYFILTSCLCIISVSLGVVTYLEHAKLSLLERKIEEINSDVRVRRNVHYLNDEATNWKQDMTRVLEPLIHNLVSSSVKDLKTCFDDFSTMCLTRSARPTGDSKHSKRAPISHTGACCERLSAPVLQGPLYQEITATAGKRITLPCITSVGYPTPLIQWKSTVKYNFGHAPGGLIIPSTEAQHEGIYNCTVSNIFGMTMKTINLKVRGKIYVNVTVPTKVFTEGTPAIAKLICNFTGTPTPQIRWQHIGLDRINATFTDNVVTNLDHSVLTVVNPRFLDSGVYVCTAVNRYETVQTIGILEVTAPPLIITPPKNKSISKGADVMLDCIILSNPMATVTWTLPVISGHKPFNVFDNGDGSITIRDVAQINEGNYMCTATNSIGSVSAVAVLDVIEPVTVKIADPRHSLKNVRFIAMDCRASGDPTPSIKWDKLGTVLDTSESRYIFLQNGDFIISSVSAATLQKDSGVYVCLAHNSHSVGKSYAIVYFDHGYVTCNSTFNDWLKTFGVAHGVQCPSGCLSEKTVVYGSGPYSMNSPICKSAIHRGVIKSNAGGLVLWYTELGSNESVDGSSKNGVTSLSSGPLFDVAQIPDMSTGLYSNLPSQGILIGK